VIIIKELWYGDNLEILQKYVKSESIDLCYIDPPFNSKRNYNQIYNNVESEQIKSENTAQNEAFEDTWYWTESSEKDLKMLLDNEKQLYTRKLIETILGFEKILGKGNMLAYLVNMTVRICEIHRVLKPTGSFYLHCDSTMSAYLRIILDSIFLSQGGYFRNEIIWHYGGISGPKYCFPRKHDNILFYSKSKTINFYLDRILLQFSENTNKRYNLVDENGKRYKIFSKKGKQSKVYMKEGKCCDDVWDIPCIAATAKERLGYPTQKPEKLLERIIEASSNEGDTVLDCYCGCGTTIAVCERLNRNWIGIDISYNAISVILKRLEDNYGKDLIKTIKMGGIPKDKQSVIALINNPFDKCRKEFEKWAILTYTNNRATINNQKGKDGGIDGIAYRLVWDSLDCELNREKILFSVKSGKVDVRQIREFNHLIDKNQAIKGIFITLNKPKREMLKELGTKIEIVTVDDILDGKRLKGSLVDVYKKAVRLDLEKTEQLDFLNLDLLNQTV